ncbi:trimeric intracellular cation channel family protein [Erythrobacter sp. SCSIO 43205]|uniref:trimeric intracellular cation channel family protein n=1 Tax=Erythrobacter sp. SCSIO 43205 TaxID=2779361 RepID=UPI001CAA35B3|nr:trimeric intracellular cation channel family protein [Erythrobacter sp. SCSIO 43205]UAB77453.1 trimeric intracellular cation channel family protein [Erythrobacter sp. SCSIO 43205]
MNETVLTPILDWLDVAGIAVFALSGALVAARERQTFVTMGFFALVTGVGGGTIRDLLIEAPVFWMHDPYVAAVCLGTALIVWFTPVTWWDGKLLDYADALGLAAYAVLGSAKALAYGIPPVPAALMGVITGCVGGVIRDVVAGRPSIIMQPELYVTAAALSAAITVGAMMAPLGVSNWAIWIAAFVAGFALRAAAIRFEMGLPSYGGKDAPSPTSEPDQSRNSSPGSGPPG